MPGMEMGAPDRTLTRRGETSAFAAEQAAHASIFFHNVFAELVNLLRRKLHEYASKDQISTRQPY